MDIYEQHKTAFKNVSAYVITNLNGDHIGRVSFKHPKDGGGRLYCYLHLFGNCMVRGQANGYGYDKATAAFCDAASKLTGNEVFKSSLKKAENSSWIRELEKNGYKIFSAV